MAGADYDHCAVCACKTFYDAEVNYVDADLHQHASLCKDCGRKWKLVVMAREQGDRPAHRTWEAQEQEEPTR